MSRASRAAERAQREVADFDAKFAPGVQVMFWPGLREGEGRLSTTSGKAWILGGTPVVSVGDYGGIALTHVEVVGHERVVKVQTFKQFVAERRRETAERHGVSVAKATREMSESVYTNQWRDYLVRAFNDGALISTRLWRSLDEGLQYRVLRSPRALRDDDLTRALRGAL